MKLADIVLTDEEIIKRARYRENRPQYCYRAIADAQLRKVAEYLKRNNVLSIRKQKSLDELGLLITMERWQQIKEIAGLK